MKLFIRAEQPEDDGPIDEVNRLAFGQEGEALLIRAIRAADGFDPSLSRVAVLDDGIVGHILFSAIYIEDGSTRYPALALAPMAVHPNYQRRGIGSQLVRDGLAACKSAGHQVVVVLGHPEFYARFDFLPANEHGIAAPFDVPDDAFLVQALTLNGLQGLRGIVRYPPCFDGL